jgi:hypothetical protein
VYAFKPEIDAWLNDGSVGRQSAPTPPEQPSDQAAHQDGARITRAAGEEPIRPSLAVLPFVNIHHDVDDEYFADGLAEELIRALSRSPDSP